MLRAIFAGILLGIGFFLAPFFIVPFLFFGFFMSMAFRRKMRRFRYYQSAMWQPYNSYPQSIQVMNDNNFSSFQNDNRSNRQIEVF